MKIKSTMFAIVLMLLCASTWASAQLINEDFSYPVGDSVAIHGWPVSSAAPNPILVTAPGLTFTGYPGSGIGNATHLTTTGQDLRKGFTPDSAGSFYSAFMVNVDSTKTGAGDYFFAYTLFDSPTSIYGRVFAKSATGGFVFGLGKNNETTEPFGTTVFSFNTTYLVVLKYTFVPGDTNDVLSLYVLPQGASLASEPAKPEVGPYSTSTKGDARNIGAITLRQGSTSTAAALTIDGIRVDTTWKGVTTASTVAAGVYSVGTGTIAGENGHFASMKAALDSLSNGLPIKSNTTFFITSDITEPEIGGKGLGLAVDPSPYTVTIKPAAGVKPVITLQYPSDGNDGPSGAFIIGMNSAGMAWADLKPTRNIVIDGSNTDGGKMRDLTIQTTGNQRNAIPMVIAGDVSNLTIKNCNVWYKVVPAASTSGNLLVKALLIRTATAANTGTVEKIPSNIIIDNNSLSTNFTGATASVGGIGGYASATPAAYPSGIVIRNNKIEGIRRGVDLYLLGSTDVYNNEIIVNQNVADGLTNEAVYAVTTLPTATYNIYNNRITSLSTINSTAATTGITGISIEGHGTFNVYNNMISGFALKSANANKSAYLYGIKNSDSTAVANIYNNSIQMDTVASIGTGTVNYRGIYIVNGVNTVKNNIVANNEDDFASFNIYRANNGTRATFAGTLTADYNDYYEAGTKNGYIAYYDTTKIATLAAWQTASGQDAKSVSGAPQFVSSADLHIKADASPISVVSNAGTPLALVTKDIDGDTRDASKPDIGADEYTAIVVSGPTVATIGEARKDLNNDLIPDHSITKDTLRVSGVITTPSMQGTQLSYFMQDATGGINIFSYTPDSRTFVEGDSVFVIGTVAQYRGLVELTPTAVDPEHFGLIKHGAIVPAAKRLTLHEFVTNATKYQGQLIELDTLYKATGTWPAAGANASVYLMNASKADTVQMFIDLDTDVDGSTEPVYPINVVGVISQYANPATALASGLEIVPRHLTDIKAITVTGVNGIANGLPTTYELMNNYPNPFNPTTVIKFALPQQSLAKLVVYDMLGREVRTLVNGTLNAGYFEASWNGKNDNGMQVASGMYIYRIEAGTFVSAKKMMLLK